MSTVIVDYGMGNLFSVKKMLDKLNAKSIISNQPEVILQSDRIILPGVGSFMNAIKNLQKYHLIAALNEAHQKNKPIWGICLGMQIMGQSSTEGGEMTQGLGWIDAKVELLAANDNDRVPHMGWNNINIVKSNSLFTSFLDNPTFYFAHSYIMKPNAAHEVVATCQYNEIFPAAIQKNNLFGTQFHPEKSQLNGKILVENFLNWSV